MARGVVLPDIEGAEQAIQVLHVGDIAAEADHRGVCEVTQAADVREAGERAI